ncbi:MAG: ketoacyl-ACP synthase III [Gemmatimonadaceae bacterium]|nr:ketoacyl-ACP synthase III [Gemmatimonadaceae bacterium]
MKRPIAYLAGVGKYAPPRVMKNAEFAELGLQTDDEWIVQRTGIRERHVAAAAETNRTMASAASRVAMERAGVTAGELDLIVLGTASPDRLLPSTAVDVQAELGATRAAAFDVMAACSSFLYGLIVAEGLMQAGSAETALVIGTEKLTTIVDWKDRSTCVLFGDGSGAAVLKKSDGTKGILSSFMRTDGRLAELLYRPAGGAAHPFDQHVLDDRSFYVKMEGREVFKHAVRSMSEAADHALDRARLTGAEIDVMIPHQANIRIIEATAKHAGIPMEKVYVNVDRYGNTSSASVPIALEEAMQSGRITEGMNVLLVAFGAGFTWASLVIRF